MKIFYSLFATRSVMFSVTNLGARLRSFAILFLLMFMFGGTASAQWTPKNTGLGNSSIFALAYNGGDLFAGTGVGIYHTTNSGSTWTAVNLGPTNNITSFAFGGTNLFAGTNGGGIFRSTDNGLNWTPFNTGLTNLKVYALAVNGTNLFAGTDGGGIFLSTTSGANWTPINTGLTNSTVYSFALIGNEIFAGTNNGIFHSINYLSWSSISSGLTSPYTDVRSLFFNGTNLFAGTWGRAYRYNGSGWDPAYTGLPNNSLVQSFAVCGTNLYAGTMNGVFLSTNNGNSWSAENTGLTTLNVPALAVSGSSIFAGTFGGGVFSSASCDVAAGATVTPGGPDRACQSASPSAITLSGASIGGSATTGAWTITSGGGILSDNTQTATPSAVTYTPDANFSGTVTLTLTTNGSPAVSGTRTITVSALPAISVITGTTTICLGSTTQLSDATNGGTWSSGSPGVASISAGSAASGPGGLVTGITVGTTTITFTVRNVAGCTNSVTQTVTVSGIPTITGTTPGSTCGTGTVTLGATASSGTINWYAALTGGLSLGTGTSFTTPAISSTTTYYVDATDACGTSAVRTAVTATINPLPPATPILGTAIVCVGSTTQLWNIASGGIWQSDPSGIATVDSNGLVSGISAGTSLITYTTPINGYGCTNSVTQIVTVNANPTITGTTPGSRCGAGTVTLGAMASAGIINWYDALTGGNLVGTGNSFTTSSISSTTTYYAEATANGCTTAIRTEVVATVNVPVTYYLDADADGYGGNTSILSCTPLAGYVTVPGDCNDFVASIHPGATDICNGIDDNCNAIVDENAPTIANAGADQTGAATCGLTTVTLAGNSPSVGTGTWTITSGAGGSFSNSSLYNTTFTGTAGTAYTLRWTVSNAPCPASTDEVLVTFNQAPNISGTTPASRCGTGTVTLGATTSAGTINWYAALTGGVSLGTGTSFTTPGISSTTTYYVEATSGGCTTAVRTAVVATINSLPVVSAPASVGIGSTITLSPTTGGTWTSGNQSIATVTNGVVTGVSAGTATFTFTNTITGCSATTSSVTVGSDCIFLSNTGFEIPVVGPSIPGYFAQGYIQTPEANVPSWHTTAIDAKIEIWDGRPTAMNTTLTSLSGNQFAELNCTQLGTLYQKFTAIPYQQVLIKFLHMGRYTGLDKMELRIGPDGSSIYPLIGTYFDNYAGGWTSYSIPYTFSGVGGLYQIRFVSISSNGGDVTTPGGNFLDNISIECLKPGEATVTAGGPDNICQSASPTAILLSGASLGGTATMGTWSIVSGNGSLINGGPIATPSLSSYLPAVNDNIVLLKLTTNSNPAISATRTITINPLPAAPAAITGTLTLCVGSTTQLADATTGGTWTSGTPGVASVNASTGLVTGVSAGTAIITYTIGGVAVLCSNSVSQTVTVNASPTITGTTPGSRCGTGTVTLGATASSGTVTWYDALTSGNLVGTGNSYTPSISSTTTYYAEATANGCTTAVRTAVIATVNALPTVAAITGSSTVCVGSTTQLSDATSGGIWTSGSQGIATVNASTGLVTGVSAGTALITYTIGGVAVLCSNSVTQTVTVNASPTITEITPAARCETGTVTLGATTSAGTINWYSTLTGGTSLGTGTSFTTPSISTTTTYYIDATSGGCTTSARTAVVATINALPTITGTTPGSVCGTGTATLGAIASAGTINWYAASTGGTSLGTGTSFTTPVLSSATSYWVDATNNSCTSVRTQVFVTINKIPTVATTTPASRCGTGTVTLGATASSGTINWYAALTGGTSLGTGSSFTTPGISSTTTYYVDATSGGCTTDTRTAVVATINTLPVVSAPVSINVGNTITLSPTTGGTWTSGNLPVATVTPSGQATGVSAGTAIFTFTNTITGCRATTAITVTANNPCIYLCNSDFEQFSGVTPPWGFSWFPQANIPCWNTTASDGLIEIWHSGFGNVPAHSGNYFAELNATQIGTLYQTFIAPGPQTVIASFWHRGRYLGFDVMKVSIVDPGGTPTSLGTYSDNNSAWKFYSTAAYPIVTPGLYTLKFESISSNNGSGPPDGGNFLDDINVTCPSSICGIKYNDLNGDGQKQTNEPVLPNWEITLTGPLTMTATTGADGSYCFNNLPSGSYTLTETPQSGWTQISPAGSGTYPVTLIEGQNIVGKDFGNRQLSNPSCTDFEDGTNGGWQLTNTLSSIVLDGTNHYLHTTDQSGASALFNESKPLTGDWTNLLVNGCGSLCFDINFLNAGNPYGGVNPPSTFTPYLAISGNGFSAYFIVTNPILAGSGWHSYCAPLSYLNLDGTLPSNTDGHWAMGVGSDSDWNSLLSNVTRVSLPVDPTSYQGEQFGYDNICLKNTGDCITLCCDKVTVAPVLDATGKPTCSAKIIATCEVKSIDVTVTNGTLSLVSWNCTAPIPGGYIGQSAYTFAPGSCFPEMTTSVNASTSGIITITYDITFSSGEKCQKKVELSCGVTPPSCCDQVKVEPVVDATGKAACCAKITTNCQVKAIAVTVTNGTLSSVNWNCTTAIPTGYIGQSTYTFGPGNCLPEMTTCVDATTSGTVTITYDITFSNGDKCQKSVQLDCSVPTAICCDKVTVEPVIDATGKAACCAKITATCEVKAIAVTVTNGKLRSANWNCPTTIPTGYVGQSAYTFAPGGCIPVLTTCVDAINSGMVMITYDIVFANGETCQKTVRLDCAVASDCVTAPTGLALWLTGDGNALDISGLNNNGTLSGGTTYSTGKVAAAFKVGNYMDNITVADNSSLNFGTGNFSSDAWIKTTDNLHIISIVDKRVPSGSNMTGYGLFIIQGKLYFQMGDGSIPISQWVPTVQLADGIWHFVAVTIDRSSNAGGNLYIDGLPALTFDPTTIPGSISNTIPLTVAVNNMVNLTASNQFTFYLDEVELFNRQITDTDIASIYNAGSAGKCKLGSICGTKFNDLNGNGRRDKDEPGIPEWKIVIGGTADLSTVTDKDGNFCFYNLEPGEYKIGEEMRYGWQQILPGEPETYTVTLPAGHNLTGLDFGNRLIPQTGSICGTKFNDLNGNGRRDEGEPGIGDWTILLGGTAEMTMTTNKNGDFCFDNLKPGTYKLGEESRTGWSQMKPEGGSYNITLAAGDNLVGQDFGNMLDIKPGSICGIKYNDLNGNGTQDSNEPGLPNWTINLTGSATMTTVTNGKGSYCFTDLKPGTYTVSETNQPLWHQTAPRPSGTYTITLLSGEYLENQNFGNQHDLQCVTPPFGMLGWWPGDDNANDITLNGDFGTLVNGATFAPGMVGSAFSLMGQTDYVNIPDRPQLNPASGPFTIDCWIQTSQATGTYAILDKRALDANQNISGYGLYVVDGYLQLRLSDMAGNGIVATLYNETSKIVADGQWHFVAATIEQGNGGAVKLIVDDSVVNTTPIGLPYLNYGNTVDLRIGEAYFNAFSQNNPGHYHNFQGMIDEVEFIFGAVSEAELKGIYYAGSAGKCKPDVLLGSICGTKFNDLNGNGRRDARGDGEPGLAGWHINLTGAATMSTTTDDNGNFCFNNLPAGQYTIAEVNQAGWIQTAPQNPNTFTVTLEPGGHIEVLNFGNKIDPTFGCVQAPSGLAGWWPFDGHAKDISGMNNHGTLIGTASYVNGKVDQGLNVNSTGDYVSVPDNSSLNFGTGNLSIDAWVNLKDTTVWGYIAFKEDISESNFSNAVGYNFAIDSKKLSFHMGSGIPSVSQVTSALIGAGKWYFVAVTVDRTSKTGGKMYINGSLVSTFDPTSVSNSISNTKPLTIASFSQVAPPSGNRVDEVELFNRALTGDEINSIYNAGSYGKCKLGSICGMKFNDLNGNGRKDEGEPGIADWQINLGGPTDMTVRTEKDGSFCFTNLNPGDYKLTEELRDGWTQTAPGTPGNFTVTLPAGRNLTGYYFGNTYRNSTGCVAPPSGMKAWWPLDETDVSKTGSVSNDLAGFNNIGTRINGPAPVPGMVLSGLQFNGTNNYVEVPDQAELNFGTGDFSFDAWIQTTMTSGAGDMVDKRSIDNGYTGYSFFVNDGKLSLELANGTLTNYVSPVFVADGKWHHVAVTVSRANPRGILFYIDGVATQYGDPTTHTGSLDVKGPLRLGSQSFATGYLFNGILDEVELFNRVITKDEIASIFNAGSSGKCKLGSICGTKFNDLNGNGRRDDGEPGIPEWQIMLDGPASLTTMTDKDGNYCFTNLVPGEYKIIEELRPDWQQKAPAEGYYGVNLTSGQNITGKDFGNMLNSQLGSICGMKYNDLNGNGIHDKDEPGIGDWTILIGGTADFTVQTDKNGEFCFTNLKPGTYKIGEQSREGWIQTAPSSRYFTFDLKAGDHITGQEFGNMLDPKTGSICGMKFNDVNGNGKMDNGEQGLPDWTINLTGTTTLTTKTDKSGNYCFRNLPAGPYTIGEGNQTSWYQTVPGTGTYSFTLKLGESINLMNFGNTKDPCYNETKSWSALGSGLNYEGFALTALNGNLIAGGTFTSAGGIPAKRIAKWDGTNWSALGTGIDVGYIATMAVKGSTLYVGGEFLSAGGMPSTYAIAKWDETSSTWSSLGTGTNSWVYALSVIDQQVYAKGIFTTAGGLSTKNIARWDGTSWFPLGSGINNSGFESALTSNGSILYAGGYFNSAGGVSANSIAKWDESNYTWAPLGSGVNGGVRALIEMGGDLYAAGGFTIAGGVSANRIAKWNGSTWTPLGSGTNGTVFALAAIGSDLYVGGDFTTAGGIAVNGIAKWDGTNWSSLGTGMVGPPGNNSYVNALTVIGSDLYATGYFITAGGVSANNVAKYSCKGSTSASEVKLQQSYNLDQNYPNPFNSTSTIGYSIPKTSFVNISVYDIYGKEIKVLVNEEKDPGHHEIVFDRKDFVSGIYFYTLKTVGFIQSKKMILMK